jgi:nucleotide-binding universal stress UspA family protein
VEVEIPRNFLEETRGRALEHLKEIVGPDTTPVIVLGHAARSIVEYAENNNVDCIVIASHQPGFSDIFLGSTAAHVVRHAKCAVHVVR